MFRKGWHHASGMVKDTGVVRELQYRRLLCTEGAAVLAHCPYLGENVISEKPLVRAGKL